MCLNGCRKRAWGKMKRKTYAPEEKAKMLNLEGSLVDQYCRDRIEAIYFPAPTTPISIMGNTKQKERDEDRCS